MSQVSGGSMRGWSVPRRSALRALAALAVIAAPAHGQFAARGAGTNDPQQGVYVRDSAIAADKFELGLRMERLKEWHKSADVYQEILKNYKDRVVAVKTNEKGQPERYASVVVAVQERFARWPEEGLAVYRARFEPEAAALLEKGRLTDLPTLHQVFDSYFALDSGKTAGMRLMDLYLENGEFSAAGWIGQRLLTWHPSLGTQRGAVLFRTLTALHLAGNAKAAGPLSQEVRKKHAAEKVVVAGNEMTLVEAVEKVMAEPAPTPGTLAADSYPMFNSDPSRSGMTVGGGKASALVHSTKLGGPSMANMSENDRRTAQQHLNEAASRGLSTNVLPVVDRGELFFQDGFRIYAVHLESGVPLSGWAQTYPGGAMGQFVVTGVGVGTTQELQQGSLRQARQNCVTLTDDAVLAVMGLPELRTRNMGIATGAGQNAGTRLVCLERANGKARWIVDPNTLPNNPGNTKNVVFSGSPLVVGENVYVIGRGMGGAGVEDCSVLCFEVLTGKYRWGCSIASAQTVNPNYGMAMISPATTSHLAFSSGRVFVCTNLGAIAAVDAYSGATAWLTIYPREESLRQPMGAFGWQGGIQAQNQNDPKPWEFNPVVVSDGKLFVLPNDGKFLHILDVATGDEFKRIPREVETGLVEGSKTKLNMLLAVAGEKLFLAGSDRDGIYIFNWQTYKPVGERKLNYDATFWKADLADLRGRPFVSRDFVFAPTIKAICPLEMRSGKTTDDRYPPKTVNDWAPGEGPGNIVVTAEHVVVATATHVNVYTDLTRVRDKYASALKNDPNTVEARLVFSELMFNARQTDEAMKVMDEAIARLGGLGNLRKGPERQRVFTDCLMFAGRLATDKTEASLDTAEELYDRAAAAANSPREQVSYRVARARFIENLKVARTKPDYARAVELYHQILATPQWRTIPITGDDGTTVVQAGKLAETAITQLIRAHGEGVYAKFQKEAAAALESLQDANAADRLLALADTYPNAALSRAPVAPKAMLKAATLYEQGGQPRIATQVLRRLYWKYAPQLQDDRLVVIEAMARNHLRAGNLNGALGRLQRMSDADLKRPLSLPMRLADGAELKDSQGQAAKTLGDAQKAILSLLSDKGDAIPDINMPRRITQEQRLSGMKQPPAWAPAEKHVSVPGIQSLYRPQPDSGGDVRLDRVLVWSNANLQCFAPGAERPLWSVSPFQEIAAAALWHGNRVVTWNATNLAVLDGDNGQILWSTTLQKLGAVDLIDTGVQPPTIAAEPKQEAMIDEGPVRVRANRIVLADRVPGNVNVGLVVPNQPVAAAGAEAILHARPLTDRLIVRSTTGRVAALALDSGAPIWQTRLALSATSAQTLATDDFVVVRGAQARESQLVALDSFNGQQLFRRQLPSGQALINMALADDGTLIWTTSNKMEGKDLYEPGEGVTWSQTGRNYAGMTRPDQLLISAQAVFAVCDQGQWIERRSLRSGEVSGNQMPTGSKGGPGPESPVQLRLAGTRLYAMSNLSVTVHHLDNGTEVNYVMNTDVNSRADDMMITQDFVLVVGGIKNRKQGVLIVAHTRDLYTNPATGKSTEIAMQAYREELPIDVNVKSWQAVTGGLYRLDADNVLKFMPGSKAK